MNICYHSPLDLLGRWDPNPMRKSPYRELPWDLKQARKKQPQTPKDMSFSFGKKPQKTSKKLGWSRKKMFQAVKKDKKIVVYTWLRRDGWKVLEVLEVLMGRMRIVSFLLHLLLLSTFSCHLRVEKLLCYTFLLVNTCLLKKQLSKGRIYLKERWWVFTVLLRLSFHLCFESLQGVFSSVWTLNDQFRLAYGKKFLDYLIILSADNKNWSALGSIFKCFGDLNFLGC